MARANAKRVAEVRAEELLVEFLRSQGWDTRKPPSGEMLRQHEYKDHPHLAEILRGISKTGTGDGKPEAFIVDRETLQPLAVIEVKPTTDLLDKAIKGEADFWKLPVDQPVSGTEALAIIAERA